jgi:hypothetical protein
MAWDFKLDGREGPVGGHRMSVKAMTRRRQTYEEPINTGVSRY